MIYEYNKCITEAYQKVLENDSIAHELESIQRKLFSFIEKFKNDFKDSTSYKIALTIANTIPSAIDQPDVLNRLTDISNLINDDVDFKDDLDTIFTHIDLDLELEKLEEIIKQCQVNEANLLNEEVTYYDLRLFLTMLYKKIENPSSKTVVLDILKALAKMEIRDIPIPAIKRLKTNSPSLFPEK